MSEVVVVSSSFGKDSTAMIHLMQDQGIKISHLMFYETGWDFPEMEDHIARVEKNIGMKATRIRYYRHSDEMLGRWGWPHGSGGWCVANKTRTCNKFVRAVHGTQECIGYTTDEMRRVERPTMKKKWPVKFPLIDLGISEKDALEYCKSMGYDWGGLYNVFNRVSCFCCPKAGKKRIEKLKSDFPTLYNRYLQMDDIAKGGR